MRLEQLREVLESPGAYDICEEEIQTEEARRYRKNRDGMDSMRCANFAKYGVDGKRLCGRHAPAHALELMLIENRAVRLNPHVTPDVATLVEEVMRLREENARLRSGSVAERKPGE